MDLLISGADLCTAVGATAEITYFSVRSGLSRFTETGAVNRQREPRIAAVLPGFRHHRDEARLAALAAESAGRALDHAGIANASTVGVTLCMSGPQRPDAPNTLDVWKAAFAEVLAARRIAPRIRVFVEAPASAAHAIQDAATRLEQGEENATLIGGADSWLSLRALRWLEDRRRLKLEDRAEGLIPGEAAGFVVLESPHRRVGTEQPLAVLRASSISREPGHYESDEPCLSVGYTRAARVALSDIDPRRFPRVLLSDLNGESYKAKEWAAAEVRVLPQSPETHLHPADCFGDVGSMAAVSQLAIAAIGLSRGEWVGPAMVIAGSDGSARGVMIAEALSGPGRLEPDLDASLRATAERAGAREMSSALVDDHLEETGFLRLQRRLAELRSAEPWSQRDTHDRRHAWHLLALAASVSQAESALMNAITDGGRPPEDRAAAAAALALAGVPSALRGTWVLMKGKEAEPGALIEAFEDLPNATCNAVRKGLLDHEDSRVRALAREVFPNRAVDEGDLLAALRENRSTEEREQAASLLGELGGDGPDLLLDSPRVRALLKPETIAWAAALRGRTEAVQLVRRLPSSDVTPRLLVALGSSGYSDALAILLHFVADENMNRADAAGASIAAITGVDVVEPGGEDDTGNETWSRAASRWTEALRSAFAGRSLPERMLMGREWSAERIKDLRADAQLRNGVRRTLAATLGLQEIEASAAAYYWLQRRVSG